MKQKTAAQHTTRRLGANQRAGRLSSETRKTVTGPTKTPARSAGISSATPTRYLKVADIATFLSLLAGILAFIFALEGSFVIAGVMLILCLVFDGLDGRIARMMNQASDFGMYLDSLVDAVVFGMVPAAIALAILPRTPLLIASASLFVAAGVYRLARFQFTKLKGEFQGMPITMNGIFVGLILIFVPQRAYALTFPIYFVISAVLMASTIRIRKP